MKNKKGFTLVELLAVIAILAILVIIALPNMMKLFNNAKKESFTTEVKNVAKTAEQQWMSDSMVETKEIVYSRCSDSSCTNPLKLSGRNEFEYVIKLNKNGKIIEYEASDGTYQYSYNGNGLRIEEITDVEQISELAEDEIITVAAIKTPTNIAECVVAGCTKTQKETELIIGGEHFYVVSSDSISTVLLAKYDLKQDGSSYSQDTSGKNTNIVKTAFSNNGYWDGCQFIHEGITGSCSSSPNGLISPYNNNDRVYCNNTSDTNCAYVYGSNSLPYNIVNSYASKLSTITNAAITGRLMSVEEAYSLSENIRDDNNSYNYWLGNVYNDNVVWFAGLSGFWINNFWYTNFTVRPVIVVFTSSL